MKVTEVRTYLMGTSRANLVLVRLFTDEGLVGCGECSIREHAAAIEADVRLLAERSILGEDPRNIEALWDQMYRGSFWARGGGPIITAAISGIEEACWDILGKSLNVPVYTLMGGRCRDRIRLYANGWYKAARATGKPADFARLAEQVVKDGYTAMKFDPFLEVMGVGHKGIPGKVLDRGHRKRAVERVRAVRQAVGDEVDICIEVHGWLGTSEAIRMGQLLEEFDPLFIEEITDPSNVDAMAKVAANINIPIATGERIYTRYGFREYIEKQVADIIQPDINITGGIMETKKIAAYADTYHITVAPHNCWGPVASAAAVQFDTSTPNFLIQEWFTYEEDAHYAIVDEPLEKKMRDGYLEVPTRPGLGVEVVEGVIQPYQVSVIKA